jgi:alkylhydroperoxidase family enzyme
MVRKSEEALGVKSDHLHLIIDTSIRAFVDLLFFMRLATHREALPA